MFMAKVLANLLKVLKLNKRENWQALILVVNQMHIYVFYPNFDSLNFGKP
jgi:hypothetical protein